jgi:hypothetical protein
MTFWIGTNFKHLRHRSFITAGESIAEYAGRQRGADRAVL